MEKISYSSKIKDMLRELRPKKGCCRKTYEMLTDAFEAPEDFEKAAFAGERMMCPECRTLFYRLLFIYFGTVTDPEKSYHLELAFSNDLFRDYAKDKLMELGLVAKCGKRRDKFTLYIKDSDTIGDFLGAIGAVDKAYDMINLKLLKEMRSTINRQNNFETANMQKAVKATKLYVDAIEYIIKHGAFDKLSEELKETAKLRVENDTVSMAELGNLHSPTISKSGVKHRLDKILDFYEQLKRKIDRQNTEN